MSTDLLFALPAPQNPTSGVQHNNPANPADADRPSSGHEPNTFLRTLKKVSREQQDRNPATDTGDQRPVEKPVSGADDPNDEAQFPLLVSIDPNLPDIQEGDPVKIESDLDLKAIMTVLSELGVDTGVGESGIHTAIDLTIADPAQLAAIQKWISQLEQNPAALTADLKSVVQQTQQAIVEAFTSKGIMPVDGNAGQGIGAGQLTETAPADGLIKEVTASSPRVPEMTLTGTQTATATVAKTSDANLAVSNPESERPAGDVPGSFLTDGRSTGETAKMAGMIQVTDSSETAKIAGMIQATDSSKAGNTSPLASDRSIAGAENENGKMTARGDLTAENSNGAQYGSTSSRPSDVQLHSTAGEEPVSRLFQETQLAREGVSRMEVDPNDEPAGKVVKSEAAAGDNSPLNSSGQNADKNPESAAPAAKDADTGQGLSRNQTVDQIVRRAAIYLRNGQQEARIDLKPDFLGHVRMQVIAENQQVTVKILAEHGFVKDMIENNLHQLKSDLQQQGLEVDKVEVSVSQDSEESANSREKLAQSRIKPGTAHHRNEHHAADEHEKESRQKPRSADSNAIVDYFA